MLRNRAGLFGHFKLAISIFGGLFLLLESAVGLSAEGARVFFQGTNAAGKVVLWQSDGTSAGTSEITVKGADKVTEPCLFAMLDGKLLFAGFNSANDSGLWKLDRASGIVEFQVSLFMVAFTTA
jgi:hypothetical protein